MATAYIKDEQQLRNKIQSSSQGENMAIQKKSLISNRVATKKALVAKPEVTTTGITRLRHAPNKVTFKGPKVAFKGPRVTMH